ncbi:MAG: hypothetical protein JSR38_19240 [Proteobacteria bacterium]|uniref:hypothetical protein n=1 Tax=Piscinibacter sp. TaxID=1903157 RepID=UPI001B71FE7F|nr:hypothetical protein [Piscinibacter sp.]MBP5992013.1 hypothetical protein [Piscinibacter sp.]MBP6029550.1 hypothetical protein [Piscinibacter sp.]MBS0444095.1 hypothetical protein [Pseudomonadota bacterium]MBS0661498.1 hypothetical protein [Verrucomicrobiota bacterium]
MPKFEVLVGAVCIGHTWLEHGDAPIGVAAGRFVPAPAYAAVQPAVLASAGGSSLGVVLRVLAPDGSELAGDGSVQIVDYSPELGDDAIEVHVIGIEPDRYVQWFNTQATGFQDTQPVPPRRI